MIESFLASLGKQFSSLKRERFAREIYRLVKGVRVRGEEISSSSSSGCNNNCNAAGGAIFALSPTTPAHFGMQIMATLECLFSTFLF